VITFSLPNDEALLAAIGKVAIRHGQLDYVLKMMVKSIERLRIREGLDATERQSTSELRQRVRKLAKQKFGEGPALVRLDALLTRSRRATDRRNELLHGLWAVDLADGREVFRHEGHDWGEQPTVANLEALADELAAIAGELNSARLEGFIKEALEQRGQPAAVVPGTRSPPSC
jgi:hypothetical protein